MYISRADGDLCGFRKIRPLRQNRHTKLSGMCVGQDEKFIIRTTGYGFFHTFPEIGREYNFLFIHIKDGIILWCKDRGSMCKLKAKGLKSNTSIQAFGPKELTLSDKNLI